MNYKKITLDTERKSFESIVAMQGDNKSRYIEATIVNRSIPVDLTGCTVKFSAIKPDITDIFNDTVISDAKGGKAQIELTNQTLAVPGVIQATLVILKEDMQLSVLPFFITVIENPYNSNAIESKSEYKALNNALTIVEGYAKELQDASVNLEEKYTTRLNNFDSQLDTKANEIDLIVERNRINNIVKNTGTTVDDLELQDIRNMTNGLVANSAGDAVREQIISANSDLLNVNNILSETIDLKNKNRFDISKKINGYFLSGVITSGSSDRIVYMKLVPNKTCTLVVGNKSTNRGIRVALFNKKPVIGASASEIYEANAYDSTYKLVFNTYDKECYIAIHYYSTPMNVSEDTVLNSISLTYNNTLVTEIDKTRDSINELYKFISEENKMNLYNYIGNFSNGEFYKNTDNTDLVFSSSIKYRVCKDNIVFNFNATLVCEDGFKLIIFYKNNGIYTNVQTKRFKVEKNTVYTIVIKRTNENISEVANIEDFTSNVKINIKTDDYVRKPLYYDVSITPPYWILHLDCARKFISVENVKVILDKLSISGFNQLQLHFSEDSGFRLKLNDTNITDEDGTIYDLSPCYGGSENSSKWYSENDMNEIILYAKSLNIDIVPSFDMPGHMGWILKYFEKFGTKSIDINNEKAVKFAEALADKYSKYFSSRGCHYWNVGADETYKSELAVKFVNKICNIVRENGLTPRVYNDMVLYNNDYNLLLPKDVEIECWYNPAPQSSFNDLQNAGYKLINSSDRFYYVPNKQYPNGATESNLLNYDLLTDMHDGPLSKNSYGAQLSIWCDFAETFEDAGDDGEHLVELIKPLINSFGIAIKKYYN